jgi:glycerol-3-phosphate dehydrogenase
MNVVLALTAAAQGAIVANHVEVVGLIKNTSTGKLCGATLKDNFTGKTWDIKCKVKLKQSIIYYGI